MAEEFPQITAEELADYVLAKNGQMSHLKLQKLLYYIQAWHLAMYGNPIFEEDFKAWVHGPVCLSVWHAAKNLAVLHGEIAVKESEKDRVIAKVEKKLSKDQLALIGDVLGEYGGKSAHYLECLTHAELPWIEARSGIPDDQPSSNKIRKETMRKFYRSRLKKSNG